MKPKKGVGTSTRPLLFFFNSAIKRRLSWTWKTWFTFFKDFRQSPFGISYLLKIVPIGLADFGHLPILKRGTHFVHNFSIKTFLILSIGQVWTSDLNYFPRYPSICILKLLLRHFMAPWNFNVIFNQLLLQCPTGQKWWEERNKKTKREWKVLFIWNKKHFHHFLRAFFWWIKKNSKKYTRHNL